MSEEYEETETESPSSESQLNTNMKIFLIVLFVVTLMTLAGYFLFYSSVVSPLYYGTPSSEIAPPPPALVASTSLATGQVAPPFGAVGPPIGPPIGAPYPPYPPYQPYAAFGPQILPPQAFISTPPVAPIEPTVSVLQSPDATSDLQSVLNYLYQRGRDATGVPWSPEVLSTLANSNNWQIQTTSPQSWLYPAGITTNQSYYVYFDDVTVAWQIRPLVTTIGQAVGGTYQTIPPNLYQSPIIRFA